MEAVQLTGFVASEKKPCGWSDEKVYRVHRRPLSIVMVIVMVMGRLSTLLSVSLLARSTPRTLPGDGKDADGGNNGQVLPRPEPPFVVPLVAVVVVVVLVCALWLAWRWYDRRAARAGEGEGEVWTDMRRAGVALGVGIGVGIQDVRGDTWERERDRRVGRVVVEERWRADGSRRVEVDAGEQSVVTSVGSTKPKMWEVAMNENENENEQERVKVSWLICSSVLSPDSLCGQPLTLGFNYELYIVRMPTPSLQPGPGSESEVVFGIVTL